METFFVLELSETTRLGRHVNQLPMLSTWLCSPMVDMQRIVAAIYLSSFLVAALWNTVSNTLSAPQGRDTLVFIIPPENVVSEISRGDVEGKLY